MSTKRLAGWMAVATLFCGAAFSVSAEEPRVHSEGRPGEGHAGEGHPGAPSRPGFSRSAPSRPVAMDGRGQVLDGRYNHGRYYAPPGSVVHTLPPDYRPYYRGGSPYYFSGGVWYAPRGPGFVVVTPPVGLVISVLPPYYSTVWYGGVPYYYADNVYYTAQPDQSGYAVVAPPDGADQGAPPAGDGAPPGAPGQSASMDLIIYPKNGQSKDQQAADEYECHNWARGQTGFDPTQPGGGVAPGDADRIHSNYDRAMAACLSGRGYQVN